MTGLPASAQLVIAAAALLLALGTIHRYIWPGVKGAYGIVKTLEQAARDYQHSGGFAGIYKELHTNGGSSLRDAVDAGRTEAQAAAVEARKAVAEAKRIGEITEELRGHAKASRDGLAGLRDQVNDVSRRVTDVDEKAALLGERQEHLATADRQFVRDLQHYIETEHKDLLFGNEALRAALNEALAIDPPTKPESR